MATLLEYTTQDSTYSFTPSATYDVYQQFTATANATLTEVYINAVSLISTRFLVGLYIYGDDGSDRPNLSDQKGGLYSIDETSPGWLGGTLSSPATLVDGTKYWIRVDNLGGNNDGANLGIDSNEGYSHVSLKWNGMGYDVLSHDFNFRLIGTVTPSAPGAPTNPSPIDTGTGITLDETSLSWDASDPAADTYEIYFREQGNGWDLVGVAQAGVEWAIEFGTLAYETTYEWRVDATNEYGTTTGNTWSFTTIDFDQIRTSYRLLPGGAGAGHGPYDDPPGTEGTDWNWTGENNMLTVRRLVVAVEDKIWYEDL